MGIDEGGVPIGRSSESELDKIRGQNPTQKLFRLVEGYIGSYSAKYRDQLRPRYETRLEMLTAARGLQRWAISIDHEIVQAAGSSPLVGKPAFEEMVGEMIQNGKISNSLDLLPVVKPHEALGRILSFANDKARPWLVFKSIFDIDLDHVDMRRVKVMTEHGIYDKFGHDYPVDEYLLELINDSAGRKGYRVDDITRCEQLDQMMHAYSVPTGVDGVSVTLTTVDDQSSSIEIPSIRACDRKGYLYIWNIALRFELPFLCSVRPLTAEEYQKYDSEEFQSYLRRMLLGETESVGFAQEIVKRPSAQKLYRQQYAQELEAIREARRHFRGTETEWTNMCPIDGLVPPWIWYDIYHGRQGY